MRIQQRDDHEKRLVLRGSITQILDGTLGARFRRALRVHEAAVVVEDPAAFLRDGLVGACVCGSQRVNPYLLTSSGTQVIPLAGLLQ
jgi:hypothetical protein